MRQRRRTRWVLVFVAVVYVTLAAVLLLTGSARPIPF
jgi:cytochrome c-type biogenesis protein CcmE